MDARDRVSLEKLEEGFWRVQVHFGVHGKTGCAFGVGKA